MSTPRINSFKKNIARAYSYKCTLTGMDKIQCDAAHIIPCARNDTEPNGIFLSTELHRSYDRYVWCAVPSTRRICPNRENFVSYDIEVSDKFKDKKISINAHKFKRFEVKSWSHPFIEEAYQDFRKENYPEEFPIEDTSDEEVICEFCRKKFKKNGLKRHQNTCSRKD